MKDNKKVANSRKVLSWIGTQIIIYGCALAGYYLIWKLCLKFQGIAATTYQGIDHVGVMAPQDMVRALGRIAKEFILFFVEWNFLRFGVTVYSVLNMLFLGAFTVILATAVWKSGIGKRRGSFLLLVLCLTSLPVGCYLWYLTSASVNYHALMLQSVCLIYILAAVLVERWGCWCGKNLILILFTVIVFNNSVSANMNYNYMQQCYEKTYALAVEIKTRIHLLDDGSVQYVAFCGEMDGWEDGSLYARDKLRQLGGWKNVKKTTLKPLFFANYTDLELSYYRENELEYPIMESDPESPVPHDWQVRFPLLSHERREILFQTDQVRDMPVWPARDSVRVIGDTVVVKLSEIEES